MQRSFEKHNYLLFQGVHSSPKFGQRTDGSCSDSCVFQDDAIVDVADILGRLLGCRTFDTQQVQNLCGEVCKFTVLQQKAA